MSWLNAARDITETYEVEDRVLRPERLSFATEGKDFRYGPVGCRPRSGCRGARPARSRRRSAGRALRTVGAAADPGEDARDPPHLHPLLVSASARARSTIKVIPRYPQVEAVEAIVERAADPTASRGSSGTTRAPARRCWQLRCGELRRRIPDDRHRALDRLDLIEQTTREFASAGLRACGSPRPRSSCGL